MVSEEFLKIISEELDIEKNRVSAAIELLDDEKTIPFIARYRKEMTDSLNEIQLRMISEKLNYLRKLEKRKEEVLESISSQDKLTEELEIKIKNTSTLSEVEDLYLPFKKRKKTRADKAREMNLEPLKEYVVAARKKDSIFEKDFIEQNEFFSSLDEAIECSLDILREEVSMSMEIREFVRKKMIMDGRIETQQAFGEDEKETYSDLYSFSANLKAIPNHRIMAINRAEKEGVIKVRITTDTDFTFFVKRHFKIDEGMIYHDLIVKSMTEGLDELLIPSIEREIRSQMTEKAELRAIEVFSSNLRNLLLTPPLKKVTVLGVDPGFRTGCKCAVVDEMGFLKDNFTIYPNQPHNDYEGSRKLVIECVNKYGVNVISIGNGTASRETEEFISDIIREINTCSYVITSEAGASVYSASDNAIEEFPDLDITTRGAISIARRIQDPLAEFVKIPPESIGVGMYQHDVNIGKLKESLAREVESVVNYVGVDINTASPFLLQYISGFNKKSAWNIIEYREKNGSFKSRSEILKVKGVGKKAFEQAAGFCRVPGSENPFDNTIVHPESYGFCEKILEFIGVPAESVVVRDEYFTDKIREINVSTIAETCGINVITVSDIKDILSKKSFDPRDSFPQPILKKEVKSLDDLKENMRLQGTVRNVVDFGAFVDIGVKVDGLIHVSKMGYRIDPLEVLYVGQIVEVEVVKIEKKRNRIGLALIK